MTGLPEVLSLEQFYIIAHMSKRKARYMLMNGIIPCIDTGKATHRFQIKRQDVLCYMENPQELDNQVPKGIFGKTKGSVHIKIEPVDKLLLSEFLASKWGNMPDALFLADCSKLTGYEEDVVLRWCQKGYLESVNYYGKLLVAKSNLIEFLAIKVNTEIKTTTKLSSLVKDYRKRLSNH